MKITKIVMLTFIFLNFWSFFLFCLSFSQLQLFLLWLVWQSTLTITLTRKSNSHGLMVLVGLPLQCILLVLSYFLQTSSFVACFCKALHIRTCHCIILPTSLLFSSWYTLLAYHSLTCSVCELMGLVLAALLS